eukprot:308532-Amphidinium_carterae.1
MLTEALLVLYRVARGRSAAHGQPIMNNFVAGHQRDTCTSLSNASCPTFPQDLTISVLCGKGIKKEEALE